MEGGESLPYLTLLKQFTKQVLSVPKTRPSPLPSIRFVALLVVDRTMARNVSPYRPAHKVLRLKHFPAKKRVEL